MLPNLTLFLERVGVVLDGVQRLDVGKFLSFARTNGTDVMLGKELRDWINNEAPAPSALPGHPCLEGIDSKALLDELLVWLEPLKTSEANTAVTVQSARFWSENFVLFEG